MVKYVYFFGDGKAEGSAKQKNLLGGKGANLAEMTNIGLPVPAGFTISTEVCTYYYEHGKKYPKTLEAEVKAAMKKTEKVMGARFGDPKNPLLVSARSGARVSMPGMMDTVLNIGLNDETIKGFIEATGSERAGWDSYRRFVQMYGDVVMGLKPESSEEHDPFEEVMDKLKAKAKVKEDTDLSIDDLKELVKQFKAMIKRKLKVDFPEDPWEQLWGAINAVFGSWDIPRAIQYRRLNGIPDDWGTAVNICSMVFGNMGDDSATGVAFTRDPSTGEDAFYGEYLVNAQGEDVVAGIRTPQPVNEVTKKKTGSDLPSLEKAMPKSYKELIRIRNILEKHYGDMQDIEFTIQKGRLWMLQTRSGKRTGFSAVRVAVDMVDQKLCTQEDAVARLDPEGLIQLLAPIFEPKARAAAQKSGKVLAKGLNAGPGAACGKATFSAEVAEARASKGERVILIRIETSPEDIKGMAVAQGILTARGGMTSHAAVVARGMGKPCVAGCGSLSIDYKTKKMVVAGKTIKEGDFVSIDGTTGEVIIGELPTVDSEVLQVLRGKMKPAKSKLYQQYFKLMSWSDKFRTIGVRTNADTPVDSAVARAFGAEGIGLCRTEHMFFEGTRIDAMREMILAEDVAGREKALKKLLTHQRKDFEGIFKAMNGLPVTIRLLDPPLHEFVPHEDKQQKELAKKLGIPVAKLKARVDSLHEMNPMLGHRGCRLGCTYPEITRMQARAIFEAAANCAKKKIKALPEVMVPLVGTVKELDNQKAIINAVAEEVKQEKKLRKLDYMVGTMIEIPRAALTADKVAASAEFFSFGTNDLTQMTFGYSRDDAGGFIPFYIDKKILPDDPFQRLDQEGVGQLVDIGIQKGRSTRKNLKVGICGEHGGEPSSVKFCHRVGMNYVSCSPYRVPVARLAAAQAGIEDKRAAKPKKK